ncbi:filamentous hemagglutinin N-terminal domain-containing protein [Alloalcanivorax marinus]|uniref:filamentous hemagglutinin N-terminal domain-containing protein n=1 Tax=Alloalcanivorax marinus TaxID=1177169 RepID=UPI0021D2C6EA|nr:filamentous hemagglutinin N-terminal domain-containing protein [Alloalcanivorax marinus]
MARNKKRNASVAVAVSVSVFGFSGAVHAGPSGGQVVQGDASITPNGVETIINQLSNKAVINWNDFSIDPGELVKFIHQASTDVTLNRVTGDTVSQIKGALTANGNIFLINPNGIVFGATAEIDVAGLLATTFDIADQDFMDGKLNFSGELMNDAAITNQGKIEVGNGGFVYLIAPNVENTGHIIANVGRVTLANDGSYDIDLTGNGLVTFSVTDADLTGATGSIKNGPDGKIEAGHVLLSGSQKDAVVSSVVNQGDITAATELTMAGDDLEQSGKLTVTGPEGEVRLQADNAITSTGGLIKGDTAVLQAGTGIGAAGAVSTEVDHLDVSSEAGAIRVDEVDQLASLKIDTGDDAEINLKHESQDPISGDPVFSDASVNFEGDRLSTSGIVETDLDFTHRDGRVTLNGVQVDGDLGVTAAGHILGNGDLDTAASGERVTLATTVDGATIGAESNPLRLDADTLRAEAQKGHVVITDTHGDLILERVSTGDNSAEAGLRALITAEDGDLRGSNGAEANVEAWATNLKADGAIGADHQAVSTAVDVLSASTQDGGIYIDEQDGELMLGRVSAGERISQGGQTVSSTGIGGADGSVTLSNGAVGDHAVKIAAEDNILIGDRISSPDELWLFSRHGGIYKSGESAVITGRFIALDAAGRLGQDGAALSTQSNAIQARSGSDGIYLAEDNGLSALDIHAEGDNAEVQLTATRGDVLLGSVQADHGDVSVVSQDGDILGYAAAPFNVRGNHLTLDADGAIGTAAEALKTEVGSLTTTTGTSLAGTYVANTGLLSSLDATTLGGNVSVTDADGGVRFERANEHLAIERNSGQGLDLTVNNGAGNLIVEGADLSGHQVNLTASGRIGGDDKVLAADGLVLDAGDDIDLTTDANRIDATTADGDIDLDNQGTGELLLNASAGGADRGVAVTHKGDLKLGQVSADGLIRLTALGTLNGDGDSTAITGNYVELEAARIGSEARPLSTAITGELSMLSGGDIFVSNVGALSLLEGEAGGDIDFAQSGDAVLGRLASGGSVTFQASGRVSDGNGDDDNIVADDLNLSAQQVGAADGSVDALEIRVDELVVDTSNGGIYLRNRDNGPLSLIRARAAGGDVNIDSAGDIGLGTVTAAGGNVTLTSDGAINDARPDGADEANVVAGKVDMRARQGIGNTGPLVLDVDRMSVSGGNGDVNAASPGAVEVDADSLVGKGASGVTIVAASITVLDNNGGILVMDGGKLVLTATNGNIVFLNQDDTIRLPGGGSITLTARADGTNEGYNGNIITGNLVTEGGDITLDADRNVTLGMLDTGGTGDVYVIARDGVILDGNGADQNVRGDHVTLIGNTPSQRDAEIARDTAIADYAGRVAELNAKILQLEVLQQQLEAYLAALNQAIVNRNISQANLASAQARVNDLSRQLNAAQSTLNTLNRVVSVAQIAVDAMAMVAGGAQAIPFSGDGGAEATFQGLSLVLSAAQVAVDEYDRNTFSPLSDRFNVALNDLDVAKAYLGDAVTNVESWTTLRNTTRVSRDMADESVFKATAARDASQLLRQQSIAAYDQAQDIDMSAAKPLGIQANQLDMGTSSGRALNSGVYLDSTGNLGLGDIESVGEIRAENVAGNISVVGDVVSPTLISLQADGAVRGIGGTWVNGEWVPVAGILHAPAIAVRAGQGVADRGDSLHTDTDEIALDAGDGDAFVINDNGGDELVLGTVDGLSGMTASGDMGLANRGDLRLKTQVVDTDVTADSDTYLVAEGGAIIDDNGDTLNVTGGDLHFGADGQVELDTRVDRVVNSGTSEGDVLLRERDDLALIALETLNGDIDVTAGGNLTVHELAAGGDSATIRLDADGRIDDDQDNSTLIAGKRLELTAGGAIGATGSVTQRGLDTAVDVVTADAKGEINVHDQDDLDVEKVTTTTGNITLTSDAGDLRVGEVRTDGEGGNITLVADGAIDALNEADDTPELYADQLALRAGNGIGTADQALLIETGALEADAGNGGLYLFNQNRDLTVGGVTPNLGLPGLTGLDANGDLHLTVADGALTVNEAVTQTGEGDTRLSSGKGQLVNANLDAAGDLTLTAATGDITAINGVQLTSDGDLSATATEGGVSLVQNSRAQADGDLTLKGGTTVSLNNASAEAGGDLTLTGENGNVTLVHGQATGAEDVTVSAGDNITVSGVSTLTATNGALKATATEGNLEISSGSSASAATTLDLKAGDQVALNSATVQSGGDMSVTAEDGDVLLTSSRAATEGAQTVSAGGSVRLTQSQLHTETDGDMKVTATNGDISLNNSQMLAGGAFDGQAGGDAVLISGLISAGGSLNPEADPANGTLDLDAGGSVRLTQGSTLTGTGDTHVGAEAGELLVVDNGKILSGADIDLSAGTNATFNTGRATAGQDLTLTAGQNVSLSGGGNLTATDGDLELTAKGNTILTNALINAGVDLALTASQGSLRMTDSDAIAGGKLDASAGQDLQLAAGSTLIANGGTLNATATDGSLNMSQSSRAAATGDVALRAGTDLALNNATAESLEQNLRLTADTGSVTLVTSQGTARGDATVTAGENLVLSAGSALTATDGDLGLTATDGNLSVSQSSRLTAGNDLTGNAGTDLAFTTGTQATAGGDLDLDAGRHLTVEDSQVRADGDAALTATAGNLSVTRSTVTAGGFLDGDAGQGILLTAATLASGRMPMVPFTADFDPAPAANVDLTLNAGSGDIALSQGTRVESAGALVMDSEEGNVSLTNGSRATAVTDATIEAGADVTLAEASRLEAGNGDLKVTATDGDLIVRQSSVLRAGGDLTGRAGGDLAFSEGAQADADGDLDLDAGDNLTVQEAGVRADGNAALTAATGDLAVTRSTVTAGGFLDGDAGGAITLTSATLNSGLSDPAPTGNVDLSLNAGSGDLTLTDGSSASAAGDLVLGSEEGSIVLTNSSRAQAASDATLTAGSDVRINNSASVEAGEGDLTVTATDGDLSLASGAALSAGADLDASAGGKITMDASSVMNSGADLTLDAVDDVALSTLRAGGDVSVTSEEGGIQADPAIAEHIHGDNLFLSAAKSIGSTLSGLKTRVTQLYATITGSGDLHLEDLDTNGLTVKDSSLADGDAHLRAGGGLTIDALAVNGDAVLDSAGRLATSAEGTLSADDLQGTAVNGIRLDSSLQSATLAVTGTGAIDLDNQGDLRLDGATTADGDINVDNGGDLGIGRVDAGDHDVALSADGAIRKDGAGEVEGVNVTLRANDGIGEWATDNPTDGFLNLTAGRIDALSVAGDLVLNQQGPVLISQARTGDGRVGLMVENGDATLGDIHAQGQVTVVANAGKLIDDGDANTRVVGDEVRLGGRDGVGTDTTAIATRANTLDLRAENGVINVEEQDGLAGLNAHIDNGDIRVRTLTGDLTVNEVRALTPGNAVMLSAVAGAILDGNAEATNIVASLLELTAATGIARASDPLDVDVQTLGATGGSGGVYINNRGTGPLTVTGLTGQGGLGLTTGGDLDLDGDLDGRRVDLSAGGDLTQRGRITGTDGVSVSGNGDVTMATGAETGSTGQVRYRAGQTLTVDRIHTTTGLGGGTVILEGRDLASNATGSGSIRAGEVRVRVLNVDSDRVYEMVDTTDGKARVSLNDRTLGGKVVEDTQYVADLTAPQSVMPRLVFEPFEPLRPADGLGFQPPADDSDEWRYQP